MTVKVEWRKPRILFVCFANVCRSPMAEGLARKRLKNRAEVASAGIAATGDQPAVDAVMVMKFIFKVDISHHVSKPVSNYRLSDFDHIVAMDFTIYNHLKDIWSVPEKKLYAWDIEDPHGLGYDACKESALKIERRLDQFLVGAGLDF